MLKKIGITTTVPIEMLLAAGYQPIDLNNVLVSEKHPEEMVNIAEKDGFPLNCCSWIKGIYGVCSKYNLDMILCVTTGDCSNTIMLMEVLKLKGFNVMPFAFPEQPSSRSMQYVLEMLAHRLGTTLQEAEKIKTKLQPCRKLAHKLDTLTWQQGGVSGWENHLWLVSTSDFNQDSDVYHRELENLLEECGKRNPPAPDTLRLAYIGVPSVYARELYDFIESNGARVVFNEIQRQFAMPEPGNSLAEQYSNYTYPYSIYGRIKDINTELKLRRIDGVIHYVQTFCHRAIGDIIFRHEIGLPILTLEGNDEFTLNSHVKTRIEAYLDMLHRRLNADKSRQPKIKLRRQHSA